MSQNEEKPADSYKTLAKAAPETIFKDRGSKFIGYAFHVKTEEDIKLCLENLRSDHAKASHVCYAWQLGKGYDHFRANDDGEPNNSAGMPIYGQLQSFDLTQTLVAVVRYYGGTNLGVGGLIHAYKTSAQITLEGAKIVRKSIKTTIAVSFDYPLMNKVMRIIKEENLNIKKQDMHLDCKITLEVRNNKINQIKDRLEAIFGTKTEILDD